MDANDKRNYICTRCADTAGLMDGKKMNYKEYIQLGFERIEMNDSVMQDTTGYSGFILTKKITDRIFIEVCFPELDKPKMYIRKPNSDTCHIVPITADVVRDII